MKRNTIHTEEQGDSILALPYWLQSHILVAEGEGEGGDENEGEEGEGEEEEEDISGLTSALRKERLRAKAAEKAYKEQQTELAQLRQAQSEREDAEKTEIQKLTEANEKLQKSLDAMSGGYLRDKVDSAIEKAAEKAGFADPSDAVSLVNREDIGAEQDPANPSEVTIDLASVDKVVKDLATRKPHFLKTGTEDGEPTGSQFGGSKKKKDAAAEEEKLKERYPSLR